MGSAIELVAMSLAILSAVRAVPTYHRIEINYGEGDTAIQDVMFDEDEQIAEGVLINATGKVSPSVNFHDFAAGYTAIKDVTNGRCFIKETAHSLYETKKELEQAFKNGGQYEAKEIFSCTNKEAVKRSELSRFGPRIAAFCENYQSVFATTVHVKRHKRSLVVLDEDRLTCIICFGGCGNS